MSVQEPRICVWISDLKEYFRKSATEKSLVQNLYFLGKGLFGEKQVFKIIFLPGAFLLKPSLSA
jgi:hypothetical protein